MSNTCFHLTLSPAAFFAGGQGSNWATVVLEDSKGVPAVTSTPITVALVSSDPTALAVPASVTIQGGAFTASAQIQVGEPAGVSVTALASGYLAGTAKATVFGHGGPPVALRVTAIPDVILPGTSVRLVMQALDNRAVPVAFPCGTLVLASSDPGVASVPATEAPACQPGQQDVVVDAGPGVAPGGTAITVAESGMTSADVKLTASGAAPAALAITVAPAAVMFGQGHAGWLVLQPVDAAGQPVSAVGQLRITLAGPKGLVPATAVIQPGENAVAVPLSQVAAGSAAIIQATATGLKAATVDLSTLAARGGRAQSTGVALHIAGLRIPIGWLLAGLVVVMGLLLLVLARSERRLRRRPSD